MDWMSFAYGVLLGALVGVAFACYVLSDDGSDGE